jgi:hypothetical protein
VCGLFSDAIHNSECAGLNGKIINKLIGKDVEGRSHRLILGIIPTFSGLNEENCNKISE